MRDSRLRHRLRAAFFYWLWLPGLVIGFGLLFDYLFGLGLLPGNRVQKILASLLLGVGLIFIVWADRDLAKFGGGTPSPAQPTKRLVVAGSFALCRHPMHFGYDLAALGTIIFFRSPAMLLLCYPLFLWWQSVFLKKEEAILYKRFKKSFHHYRNSVPFLLPLVAGRKKR